MEESFFARVYQTTEQVPPGKVATYGQIALLAGSPRAARAVGEAMRRCPYFEVPCHRVLNCKGELSPTPAFGGPGVQRALLEGEGIIVGPDNRVDLSRFQWDGIGK